MTDINNNKTHSTWDMSQERAFIENLLSQRFNYFILFYSITISGFINTDRLIYAQLILIIGSIISVLFACVLKRSQQKLDIILKELFKDKNHPAKIIDDMAKGTGGSRRRLVGVWIPFICCLTLIIASVVHLCYILCLCQRN